MASKLTSIRIPDDLYTRLAERAKRERRTVSNMLVAILSAELLEDNSTSPQSMDSHIDAQAAQRRVSENER